MIARLLISPSINKIREEVNKTLALHLEGVKLNHPDILYFKEKSKLGIAEAKKIKEHFSLKPYSATGRGVVLEDVSAMTAEAQNALLKTLEELPEKGILILGSNSEAHLLSTILSRCQIIHIQNPVSHHSAREAEFAQEIDKLLTTNVEERFAYIEKLKSREEFLYFLVSAFRKFLYAPGGRLAKLDVINFLKDLQQAEEGAKQNVNIRAILEYLMLVMPYKI